MTAELLGVVYLLATVVGFGASTAFLRVAILDGTTDGARLLRVGFQTLVVLFGVLLVGGVPFSRPRHSGGRSIRQSMGS